jgi:hypothetical protein
MFGFVICDITNEYKKWSNVEHMLKVCMFKYFQNHLMEMIKTCNICDVVDSFIYQNLTTK